MDVARRVGKVGRRGRIRREGSEQVVLDFMRRGDGVGGVRSGQLHFALRHRPGHRVRGVRVLWSRRWARQSCGVISGSGNSQLRATSGPNREPMSPNIELIGCQSVRPWFELPFAADCCPCVEKLRTVLPLTVGIRDGAVQLVSRVRWLV